MCSPLEQFSLQPILPLTLWGRVDASFSNATLFTLISMGLVLALVKLTLGPGVRGGRIAPAAWQTLFESFYDFVDGMCREQLANSASRFTTTIFGIFSLLISLNLFGLLPYSFTVTSQLSITLSFSSALFIGITLFGIRRHGLADAAHIPIFGEL